MEFIIEQSSHSTNVSRKLSENTFPIIVITLYDQTYKHITFFEIKPTQFDLCVAYVYIFTGDRKSISDIYLNLVKRFYT